MGDTYTVSGSSANVGRGNVMVRGDRNVVRQDDVAETSDALRELVVAVRSLREVAPRQDRPKVDAALRALHEAHAACAPGRDPKPLRTALSQVAGIAAVIGQAGLPVIAAVLKVSRLMGL